MKSLYITLSFFVLSIQGNPCGGSSISLDGHAIVAISASTGALQWKFGQNLTDPQVELGGGVLLVTAQTEDEKIHTWELSLDKGALLRELEPRDLNNFTIEYKGPFTGDAGCPKLSRLESLPKFRQNRYALLSTIASNCRVVIAQPNSGKAFWLGLDRNTGNMLWEFDLRREFGDRWTSMHACVALGGLGILGDG